MNLEKLLTSQIFLRCVYSIITLLASIIFYKLLASIIVKSIESGKIKVLDQKKTKTYTKLSVSILRYLFVIVTLIVLLQVNGVNVSSMLAGVGILSIIIGFAIQDALKDIIKGADIISDNYYQVGDVIKFGSVTGKVLSIGLKTTKIEDVYTLNIVSISNRNIEQVEVVSNLINIDIPLPYELKLKDAESVLDKIVFDIKELDNVDNCEYRGVQMLDTSSINYQIKVYCKPILKVQTRRDVLGLIVKKLEENKISIPYQQIDIHNK